MSESTEPASSDHLEKLLDEALEDTFPASDPPAVITRRAAEIPPLGR